MAEQTASPVIQIAAPKRRVGESLFRRALRHLSHDWLTMIAITIVLILTLASIFAPFISQQILHVDPFQTKPADRLLPPGTDGHILGTDDLGRDQLGRLLYAGQVSLAIGFFGAVLSLVIGMALGTMTGYFGGVVDDVMN